MLRIPSRRCQARGRGSQTISARIAAKATQPGHNPMPSPIKRSTKVPLTLTCYPPNLRSVGHWLRCGIGESLSKTMGLEVCANLMQ